MKVNINNNIVDLSLVTHITPLTIDRQYRHWVVNFTIHFVGKTELAIACRIGVHSDSSRMGGNRSIYTIYAADNDPIRTSTRGHSELKVEELNKQLENTEPVLSRLNHLRAQYEEIIEVWQATQPRIPELPFAL